jgi:predicted nucleotidyltransferase component of viral defense system
MISIDALKGFFPAIVANNPAYGKLMLSEFIQCQILEYLSRSKYITNLSFIGGTHLRLIKHIDRFSEDLDFDCKGMSPQDFRSMTDSVIRHVGNLGYHVEPKEREHDGLNAYRRSLFFPNLLYDMGLSGHTSARFLIKIEMQDQQVPYKTVPAFVRSCGFYVPIPVPPDDVLCSMKISALLNRGKGRDFYDVMFLLSRTKPDYAYLAAKHGIRDGRELQNALEERIAHIDLKDRQRDVEHLLFDSQRSSMITHFASFMHTASL